MAVTYGFYDSLNHDRLYNAQQMSAIFDGIINDGVFMSVGNQFHTVEGTGMQVIVKSGRAWFDSTWTLNDAEYPLSIDAADVLLTRIDAVVLEVNSEVATRANTIKIVKGTPASTPAKPTLTNTATIHQHALAYVTVAKNTTAITNSMIEIVVGKTETPYVTAILQTTDITDLFNQWEDYFQTWFDTVRGTLDGDIALNLQNQITSLRRETLKNTTPPIIGLPASATPDDMFQALAKTGDLHVWRKTMKNAADVPAGYNLGEKTQMNIAKTQYSSGSDIALYIDVASSVTVSDSGDVSLSNATRSNISLRSNNSSKIQSSVRGKFVTFTPVRSGIVTTPSGIYFIPSDATVSYTYSESGNPVFAYDISAAQTVIGYPKTPAGTTTTYPVSTNPNAYQEGSDAKPAGYTLGEVVSGQFKMSEHYPINGYYYKYASSISVADNGTISLDNPSQISFDSSNGGQNYANSCLAKIAGKFMYLSNRESGTNAPDSKPPFNSVPSAVVYIPSDATLAWTEGGALDGFTLSKYQPVTGYAAIPAGTTIEYLGKLGDKARLQVVSYVGTGTYGVNNKNKLTFSGKPRFVIVPGVPFGYAYIPNGNFYYAMAGDYITLENLNCVWNDDTNTMTWYHTSYPYRQYNESGRKYTFVAIY